MLLLTRFHPENLQNLDQSCYQDIVSKDLGKDIAEGRTLSFDCILVCFVISRAILFVFSY